MAMTTTLIWMLPVVAFFSFVLGFLVQKLIIERTIGAARAHAKRLAEEAERDAEARRRDAALEAKEIALKARTESEQETRQRQREIQEIERRVLQKEEQLGRRLEELDRRGKDVQGREQRATEVERSLKGKEERLDQLVEEQRRKLDVIAGLTAEEAKRQLLAQMEEDARREAALVAMRIEEEARETAHQKAKEVLATTIQRLAPDYTIEISVSTLDLPSDDMKGRIIGREGRIHPARIEEVVEKVKKEVDQTLREEGEKACMEVNVHGLHPELVRLVGRMKFRTSYGQNCLQHSKEVAWLAGMMAAEIKADAKLARRMGLLHDIGKALTHEQEGSHPELSEQVLTKYNESPAVINAALCGHENIEPQTVEAVLVEAADGISAARPGARRDVLESYIKRLPKLEEIATSYKGVDMAYAIQAGREVRIMVKSDVVSDLDAHQLAKDISKRIESEMQYPGHIKVTVIRETRAVEIAK